MLRVVTDADARAEMGSSLDEIVLDGARCMLAAALEVEADDYIARLSGELDERGRRLVVRNGHAEPCMITTAAGRIEVTAPRINDKRVDEDGDGAGSAARSCRRGLARRRRWPRCCR
jgi:hypothetical protein